MQLGFENMKQHAFDRFPPSSPTPCKLLSVFSSDCGTALVPFFTSEFKREVKRRTFLTPALLWLHWNLVHYIQNLQNTFQLSPEENCPRRLRGFSEGVNARRVPAPNWGSSFAPIIIKETKSVIIKETKSVTIIWNAVWKGISSFYSGRWLATLLKEKLLSPPKYP